MDDAVCQFNVPVALTAKQKAEAKARSALCSVLVDDSDTLVQQPLREALDAIEPSIGREPLRWVVDGITRG